MKIIKYICGFFILSLVVSSQFAKADDSTNSVPPKPLPNEYWGAEINGIRAGLYVHPMPVTATTSFDPLLYNGRTNIGNSYGTMMLYSPPFNNRYRVDLKDENGKVVVKTAKGTALGAPITKPLRAYKNGASYGINTQAGYGSFSLDARLIHTQTSGTFKLPDYFKIEKSGKYHLHFETCVIIPKERSDDFVWLPPVDIDVDVQLQK